MRSLIFWIVFTVGYATFIAWNVYMLRDIAKNPQKYEQVKGRERYRESFWHEYGYKRYGKHYHASLIIGIPLFLLLPLIYCSIGYLIQRYILIPAGSVNLPSIGIGIGCIAAIFCSISVEQFIMFTVNLPIFVAARLYWGGCNPYVKAWRNTILLLLIMGIICLPFMAIGINAYSYADEEKIVTHGVFSLREKQIPYDTVISGETSYSYDEEENSFVFQYTIVLKDGYDLDIYDFGPMGASYIDDMLQRHSVATAYGTVDADTYEQMRSVCDENTMKFVDQCFTVNNR